MNIKIAFAVIAVAMAANGAEYPDRWVHVRNDLMDDEKLVHFEKVVGRAAACGFNGVMWDAGIGGEGVDFDGWTGMRRKRLEEAKRICQKKGMEIIPMLWSVGRAHALVNYDPTLAEGLPVRGVPFVAERGKAVFDASGAAAFEDAFGGIAKLDAKGRRSVWATLKVKPHRRYRIEMSVRVKGFSRTSGEGANKVTVRSSLSVSVSPVKGGKATGARESMPLRRFDDGAAKMMFDFVTMDADAVKVSAGIPARALQGEVTVERLDVREVGLRRPVVRAGLPLTVRNAETGAAYAEDRDYLPPKSDAAAARADDRDVEITIPEGSTITPGTRLVVDCHEAARRGAHQVGACMANPGLYEYFEKSAPVIDELFGHPKKWFLSMDEIRAGGTCEACAKSGRDLAHLLAQCLERQRDAIRKVRPDAIVYAWCDMYDPFVNAKPANRDKDYALCRGGFASDGFLAPKDIVAVVWGGEETAAQSFAYFAGNGVPTLYGTFYDVHSAEHFRVRGATGTVNKVPGCRGLMYTTWVRGGKYDLLEKFGEFMKADSKPMPAPVVTWGEDFARWVDPFIGTAGTANCHPNACYPHGLVQAGPTSGTGEWKYCGGYQLADTELFGFVQNAVSGTGCPDLGDIRLQPFAGEGENARKTATKADEKASPGFYSVRYPKQGIATEVTVSPHVAFYRFAFRKGDTARLLVDLQWGHCDKSDVATHVVSCETSFPDATTLTGHLHLRRWVERDCYFAMKFSKPVATRKRVPRKDVREKGEWHELDFGGLDGEPLLVKVSLSRTSIAAAERNLAAEVPHWDFARTAKEAREAWNELFARCQIEGSDDQKTAFYTSMYHLFIAPNDISDVGEKPFYSTLSFWDTFRAAHPLYTILAPERVPGMVDSILAQGKKTGFLPIWCLWGVDNQCMIGTHSVPVIVDWFLKVGNGERGMGNGEYWLAAYEQIKETLTKPHKKRQKERWDLIDKYGYYPFDEIKGESVSRTLECAYDDWCAGVMAEKLRERGMGNGEWAERLKADAEFFFKRSENWRNVFDASIGLVRGKDSNGKWREPYDPYTLGHGADRANDFTEGNAFQYTWHVMQNPQGLVDAMGGRDAFVKKLDSLFEAPSKTEGMGEVLDVTGLIGQYVQGNEPSHHVLYFYPQVGHPEKAAARIREVFDKFYLPKPDGLCGNDDCGQMSAWYIFSAMGFYPFNPCGGEYVLGAPQVACAKLRVESGEFRVVARNLSKENKYVKSVMLNGKPITDWKIRHSDIMSGGELVFEMYSGAKVQ